MTLQVHGTGFRIKGRPQPHYEYWSVEELRAFGAQLQLPNARLKTREELLDVLNAKSAAHERGRSFS